MLCCTVLVVWWVTEKRLISPIRARSDDRQNIFHHSIRVFAITIVKVYSIHRSEFLRSRSRSRGYSRSIRTVAIAIVKVSSSPRSEFLRPRSSKYIPFIDQSFCGHDHMCVCHVSIGVFAITIALSGVPW